MKTLDDSGRGRRPQHAGLAGVLLALALVWLGYWALAWFGYRHTRHA